MSIKSFLFKKTSILINTFFLVLSGVLIFYVYLKYRISTDEFPLNYYFKYFVITILFFIFSIIIVFIKREYKINIFLSFISFLFAIYLIEFFLFQKNLLDKVKFKKEKTELIKKNNINFDYRSEVQIYKDLKKEDPSIVKAVVPKTFLSEKDQKIIPLSGISNSKTLMCNENGYYAFYFSDEYGFRNPKDVWKNKKNEIVILGDSFAHGACVNDKDTITGNLKRLLKTEKIINLGFGGNGPLIEYAAIREYLHLIKPNKLIWIYYEHNDLLDLSDELKNKILNNYLVDRNFNQNLINKKKELDFKIKKKLDELFKSKLSYSSILKLKNLRSLAFDKRVNVKKNKVKLNELPISEFRFILQEVKYLLDKKNIKFYFVYLPEYKRSLENIFDDKQLNNYGLVIDIVKNLDIELIDMNELVFKDFDDPLSLYPFRSYGHFNELGYRVITDKIFENLTRKP